MAGAIAEGAGVPPAGVVVWEGACMLMSSGAAGLGGVIFGCSLCVNSTAMGSLCCLSAGFSDGRGVPLLAGAAETSGFFELGAVEPLCGACANVSSTAVRISISSLKLCPAAYAARKGFFHSWQAWRRLSILSWLLRFARVQSTVATPRRSNSFSEKRMAWRSAAISRLKLLRTKKLKRVMAAKAVGPKYI